MRMSIFIFTSVGPSGPSLPHCPHYRGANCKADPLSLPLNGSRWLWLHWHMPGAHVGNRYPSRDSCFLLA